MSDLAVLFLQAMMELGATVCKPANPDCARCPVQSLCTAHADWQRYVRDGGDQDIEDAPRVTNYPEKVEKVRGGGRCHVCNCKRLPLSRFAIARLIGWGTVRLSRQFRGTKGHELPGKSRKGAGRDASIPWSNQG